MQENLNSKEDISMREALYFKFEGSDSFCNGIMFFSSRKDYVTLATIDADQNVKAEWLPKEDAKKYVEKKNAEKKAAKEAEKKAAKEAEKKAAKKVEKDSEKNAEFEVKKNAIIKTGIFSLFTVPIYILYSLLDDETATKVLKEFFSLAIKIPKEIFSLFCSFFSFFANPKFLLIVLLVLIVIAILRGFANAYIDARTARFRAANHMVINAYSKLHRIPSIEELSKCSRLYMNCPYNLLASFLIICMAALSYLIFKVDILLCAKICMASSFACLAGLLNWVQVIITKPPTEMELNVAIIGMKAWLENEQMSQRSKEN